MGTLIDIRSREWPAHSLDSDPPSQTLKIREMEENQSVRMEELSSKISFPLFPLRIGWRMEWI